MARVGPSSHVLVELISDLPGGYRDVQSIISILATYDAEVWEELIRRVEGNRGRWKYCYLRIVAWVPKDSYHPFATSVGAMRKNGNLQLKPTTYL